MILRILWKSVSGDIFRNKKFIVGRQAATKASPDSITLQYSISATCTSQELIPCLFRGSRRPYHQGRQWVSNQLILVILRHLFMCIANVGIPLTAMMNITILMIEAATALMDSA
jgi:hypothetical protein